MKINQYIFRNYDIRGIVDVDLDEEKILALGKAYGTFLHKRKIHEIICGRDCRLSGPAFQTAFMNGVLSTGIDVIDIGMVMTQMMYFAQYYFQTNGGAMLTASHNPSNYNGFKLAVGYSQTTGPDEVQELRRIVEADDYFVSEKSGTIRKQDIKEAYIQDILKRVRITKKFKVVVDSHNGTTGAYIPEILRRAGCEVIEYNTTVDGHFPNGTPDPTDAHLMNNLSEQVIKNKAELGFAYDGDGDRIGFADEMGHVLWNDVAVAIFALDILKRFPKSKIVYNTLCSQVVQKVIELHDGIPVIWKTGHAFIKQKIAEERAAFGGELSGHFFFADNAYGHDDGSYATLRILEYLSESNQTLSHVYASFPVYISSPEIKIGCADDKKKQVIELLSQQFKKDFPNVKITDSSVIPGDDGVRADFDDGMMVFRYSQNGPYITIKFEATTKEKFEERRIYVRTILHKYPDIKWEAELAVNLDIIA